MDTTKLVKAIQIIVKEEVKKEMAKREKVIRESILKEVKKSKPKRVEADPLDVDHIFEQKQQTQKKEMFKSTGFADLLNETADNGEWRSINGQGGMFNSTQAQGWGGGLNTQNSTFQTAEGRQVSAQQLQQTEAGQAVVNAVTRDYSALMKAIDKKKGK
jgi:hypothetical protein